MVECIPQKMIPELIMIDAVFDHRSTEPTIHKMPFEKILQLKWEILMVKKNCMSLLPNFPLIILLTA